MALTPWEPVGIGTLSRQLNRMFQDLLEPELGVSARRLVELPRVNVYETEKEAVIEAELPGMDMKDVEVTASDEGITLRGEFKRESEVNEENYLRSERRFGSFTRTIALPSPINAEQARASFRNGVLTIKAPFLEGAKPRKIAIEAEGQQTVNVQGTPAQGSTGKQGETGGEMQS